MKLLPYPENPIFICYHNKAFPMGVIQANAPGDITKWLCTKGVNVSFNPNSPLNKFDLAIWDAWATAERVITQQMFTLKKKLIPLINVDLLSMFKTFIDHGCYIQGTYNEKHIPSKQAYKVEDFNHDFLIIGYDDDNFESVGFVADGQFRRFKIPNQNFIDAVTDTGSSRVGINFYSYNEGAIPIPNIERMLTDMDIYISTANQLDDSDETKTSYGILALKRIKDFFLNEVVNNGKLYVDRRYSRVLYEHEWVFTQVINEFLDTNERNKYINYAKVNLERAHLVHMLGLKLSYTGNKDLIWRIVSNIEKIIEDEMKYIPELLELLKTKHEQGII